jgi:ribonucleoside-diphosphate reductase beta chain
MQELSHSVALDLYHRAKREGNWDPQAIDLERDWIDWVCLAPERKLALIRLCAWFLEGEESVASQLAPWLMAMDGVDRQMFLAAQIFEETKHAEFIRRYFREVFGPCTAPNDLPKQLKSLLVDELAEMAERLRRSLDGPPGERLRLLVEGVAHWHGVVEGVLAPVGYAAIDRMLDSWQALPGLREGFRRIRADEARHVAFGMDFLREAVERDRCLGGVVLDAFNRYMGNLDVVVDPRQMDCARAAYCQRLQEIGLQS